MGAVIGKQGAVVREISGRSGAIIDVEKVSSIDCMYSMCVHVCMSGYSDIEI